MLKELKNKILIMEALLEKKTAARDWSAVQQLAQNIKDLEAQLPTADRIAMIKTSGCAVSVCNNCSCGKAQRLKAINE